MPRHPTAVNINDFSEYIQEAHPDHPYAQEWIRCIRNVCHNAANTGQVKNGLIMLREEFQTNKRTIKQRDNAGNVIGTVNVHDIQIGPQRGGVDQDEPENLYD